MLTENDAADKNEMISLLSLCFGMTDSESAIMLADAAENGACHTRVRDGKAVSAALTKPLRLRFGGADRIGVYIFGLCTVPEYRGRGLAKDIIGEICAVSNADFALLIPERADLFTFYETLGFRRGGIASAWTATASRDECVCAVSDPAEVYAAYEAAALKCGDACLLSKSDLAASMALSRQTCVAGESGVCFVSGDGCEAFAPCDRVAGLAASALALCGIANARVTAPVSFAPDGAETFDIGMIKTLRGQKPPEAFYINNLFNL